MVAVQCSESNSMDMITPNRFGNNSDDVNDDNDDDNDDDDDADYISSRFNDEIQQHLYNEAVTSAGNYLDLVTVCTSAEEEVAKIEQFMDILGVLLDSYEFEDDPDELQQKQKHLRMWSDYENDLSAAEEFLKKCQSNKKIACLKYEEDINAYNFYVDFRGKVHEELQQMTQTVMQDNTVNRDDLPTLAECMELISDIVGMNSDRDELVEMNYDQGDVVEADGKPGEGITGGLAVVPEPVVKVTMITDVDKLITYTDFIKDIWSTRFRQIEPNIVHWNFIYWVNMIVMSYDLKGNVRNSLFNCSIPNCPYDRGKIWLE